MNMNDELLLERVVSLDTYYTYVISQQKFLTTITSEWITPVLGFIELVKIIHTFDIPSYKIILLQNCTKLH